MYNIDNMNLKEWVLNMKLIFLKAGLFQFQSVINNVLYSVADGQDFSYFSKQGSQGTSNEDKES